MSDAIVPLNILTLVRFKRSSISAIQEWSTPHKPTIWYKCHVLSNCAAWPMILVLTTSHPPIENKTSPTRGPSQPYLPISLSLLTSPSSLSLFFPFPVKGLCRNIYYKDKRNAESGHFSLPLLQPRMNRGLNLFF